MVSILTMAIFSSITNFGSATTTECFGTGASGATFCTTTWTKKDDGIDMTSYYLCTEDKDRHWQCETVKPAVTTPEIKQAIGNTVKELAPSSNPTPSNSKNLGGMQTQNGITQSPTK